MLIRITSPWFVAGVEILPNGSKRAAPIIHYMKNFTINKILSYSKKRGWKAMVYYKGRYINE